MAYINYVGKENLSKGWMILHLLEDCPPDKKK
jgi:hypothetical protein